MKKSFVVRMVLLLALLGLALPADCVLASSPGMQVEKVHFIIPGGAGGGRPGTGAHDRSLMAGSGVCRMSQRRSTRPGTAASVVNRK